MEKKRVDHEAARCFGCGRVLSTLEQEVGLCKSCSERSITEGFEMIEAEERDKVRAEAMMYC